MISSQAFNQDVGKAKQAALAGPVFITGRDYITHVLLSTEEYQKITDKQVTIVDLLAMPEAAGIEFDPPRLANTLYRSADFS
jgi:hypothetical protein